MNSSTTSNRAARAYATGTAREAVDAVSSELRDGLAGQDAAVVLFFASSAYEPGDLAGPLTARFPEAVVLGCSTAGEFTNVFSGIGGISAVALPTSVISRRAAALADLTADIAAGTAEAVRAIEAELGTELRTLDPARNLGLVLIDGMHGAEEEVNIALGNAAPVLDIVGGSAGDDLMFKNTWVSVGDRVSFHGAALVVCETTGPFTVLKTCTFTPTGAVLQVTKADTTERVVHEFDGRPAVEAYAEAIGRDPADLDSSAFMEHPVGLMIDDAPFIRSPQQLTGTGGIKFYAQILEGMEVDVMQSGEIVAETSAAFAAAVRRIGGVASGAVLFNCILRRLELDAKGETDAFVNVLKDVPLAGFHTYGETWLGHMNQTLTGVVFS
ncbi:FIST signal transduction protein [Pengzhenrongella sp.]|jgi:hypothetical protein|uniref:FIST signal transduction protein n=1 Tax=Pengzhenrongella sp. TaxID=2888820 RepID=UPI002F92F196